MAVFGGLKITNAGMNLEAKAQMGKQLKLKRIALGDGQLTSESMITMKSLINEVLSCEIKSIKLLSNNIAKVTFYLTNQELNVGFTWRELGVIAEDPDTHEEVLYCYGNARENGEYICAKNEQDILELYVSIDLITSNASNITAIINGSLVFATKLELEELEERVVELEKISIPQRKNITLASTDWTLNEATQKYEYTVTDTSITEDDYINVDVLDTEKEDLLSEVNLDSYSGYYVFTSSELIEEDIALQLIITRTKAEVSTEVEA